MPQTLAQAIRAKYPGQYDDLSDAELEARIDAKHPGAYDDLPRTGKASGPLRVEAGMAGGEEGKGSSAGTRFAEGVWKNVNPVNIVKGVAGMVAHPIDTLGAAKDQMAAEWEKAGAAGIEGRWSEAAGHGLAGSLPFVGPAAAAAGERIGSGDVAGGLGEGVGLIAASLLPRAAKAVVKGGTVPGTSVRVPGALDAANRIRAPFAGELDAAVTGAATRAGVQMPASAVSTSRVVPVAEAIAAKGLAGKQAMGRITAAVSELTSRADHLVRQASKLVTEDQRGAAIAQGFDSYRKAWIRTKGALYNDAKIPEGLTVKTSGTVDLLRRIIADKKAAARTAGTAGDLSFYEKMLDRLTEKVEQPTGKTLPGQNLSGQPVDVPVMGEVSRPRAVKVADLREALKELNAKIGGAHADAWSAANKQLLKKVAATIGDEFEGALKAGAPEVAAKLEAANTAYRAGLSKINSTFGQSINKLAQQGAYDKIGRAVANARMSADHIPGILEVAGPEGAQAIQASVLADIVSRAKNTGGQLTPQGLAAALKNWERSSPGALDALLTPEQMGKLRDLSTLTRSLEKVSKVAEGSQTAFLGRVAAYPALLVTSPMVGLQAILGDLAFSKFIGSAAGQKWLTTGFKPWSVTSEIDSTANRVGAMAYSAQGRPVAATGQGSR